jgi:hypothetical protein
MEAAARTSNRFSQGRSSDGFLSQMRPRRKRAPARKVLAVWGACRIVVALLCLTWSTDACAYRPFDGTDADVAEPHEWEFEMQTVGYYRIGTSQYVDPGGVLNYGLVPRVEIVLQGFGFVPYDAQIGPSKFTETGLFAKVVWREGCLQEKDGPSFATETGPLLPTINDTKGFGAYWGSILSTCIADTVIAHWNTEVQILPQTYDLDLFGGVILEPASKFVVRPVAEFFVEHDFGGMQTYSGLAGAIWQVSEKLALDVAVRGALISQQPVGELRAGFSLAVP